jgi:hypothetical protein
MVTAVMKTLCQIFSVLIGLFAAIWMFVGIIPLLGALNWLVLVFCVGGIIFGVFPERKIGLTINIAVGVVAIVRLILGGGAV